MSDSQCVHGRWNLDVFPCLACERAHALANDPLRIAAIEYLDAHMDDPESHKRAGFSKMHSAAMAELERGLK